MFEGWSENDIFLMFFYGLYKVFFMFDIDMFEGWSKTEVFSDVFMEDMKSFYVLSYQWNT